jgi:hypothetical protein
MAGKTGTAAVNYAKDGGSGIMLHHLWVIFRPIILNILVLSYINQAVNNIIMVLM